MKKIISCTFAIGFMLVLAGTSFARPSGEVKASPLYQQSLQQSIAQMDGKVEVSAGSNQVAAAGLPTSSNVCPAVPYTQQYTCTPTAQGGYTCAYTCTNTCASTCANTCNQATCASTCSNTCYPGACQNYQFYGYAYWYYYGYAGSDWGYNGLGYYYGIEPRSISVYADYSDNQRRGGWGINYANSYYNGTDTRTTLSGGSYYVDGGGWCEPVGDPYDLWGVGGSSSSHALQLSNRTDFYINVAPN